MDPVHPVEIPASHIKFANAVAALADVYGMDRMKVEYRPKWDAPTITGCCQLGEATIIYRSTDSRGRECKNLQISVNSIVTHEIIRNEESSN